MSFLCAQALLQGASKGAGASSTTPSATPATGGLAGQSRSTYLYELSGVVVHSGSAFVGHYYSYIKERPCVGERGKKAAGCGGAGVQAGELSA